MYTGLILLLACGLDYCMGEPRRLHPLVGFGYWATRVESWLYNTSHALCRGILAWGIVVVPIVVMACIVQYVLRDTWGYIPVAAFVLYICIGWKSLIEHGENVALPLLQEDIPAARKALGMIVSRDVEALDETGIASAATESMLENGADAIFAPLFWFAVLGMPGVVLYRCANTLDAMWGYKSERYLCFGKSAARIDDVLNWLPARITVLAYMCASGSYTLAVRAFDCARQQGRRWKSPNAGPVMASGAAALGLELGGAGKYHGVVQQRGILGCGCKANANDIRRAIKLVNRALGVWLVGLVLIV